MKSVAKAGPWTWTGIAIALFGIPLVVTVARLCAPTGDMVTLFRELAILALSAALLLVVTRGERRPLSSIGLQFDRPGRSLGQGLLLAVVLFASVLAMLALFSVLGIHYGDGPKVAPSLGLTALTVVRAGFSEELFYRGFALGRIAEVTGSKWIAIALSLSAFALFHYRGGLAGIALAFVLGAVLTAYYLWKRDLLAAMIAHFLVDFIPNVLPLGMGN